MITTKYLIIGGGVAGTTAAETIRKNDPDGKIIIVSDEPYRFYSRIMLSKPNFFLGKIPFEKVFLKTPEFYSENKIELLVGKKAIKLNAAQKIVSLNDGEEISYDKLLLAIGGCARQLTVPGTDKKGVRTMRTLDDAKDIIETIKNAKKAVAIGGGFVSLETADIFRQSGLEVTVIIREPRYWANLLDEEASLLIEEAMVKAGIIIIKEDEVKEILGEESVTGLKTNSGKTIECQIAVVGIGLACPFDFLQMDTVKMNHGIVVNEYLECETADIWAAGDAAEFNDVILGERIQLGNWANAQMQGHIAGLNMTGQKTKFELLSSYTTSAFGLNIAFIGNVHPSEDKEIIRRGTKKDGSFGRLMLKNNKLVGAALFNKTQELAAISKLITRKIDLSDKKTELADPSFDLTRLIA